MWCTCCTLGVTSKKQVKQGGSLFPLHTRVGVGGVFFEILGEGENFYHRYYRTHGRTDRQMNEQPCLCAFRI